MRIQVKIVLGIIIPILLIIVVFLFGSFNLGISAKKSFVKELTTQDVLSGNENKRDYLEIGKIELENKYFFSQRYELKSLVACLVDNDQTYTQKNIFGNTKRKVSMGINNYAGNIENIGKVRYSEIVGNTKKEIFPEYISPDYNFYPYEMNAQSLAVEIKPHEIKILVLEIPLKIDNSFFAESGQYDEIIILKGKDNDLKEESFCVQTLKDDVLQGTHIKLPFDYRVSCIDEDKDKESENIKKTLKTKGVCRQSDGTFSTDYCIDNDTLAEYECYSGYKGYNRQVSYCRMSGVYCKGFGFSHCEDGVCVE